VPRAYEPLARDLVDQVLEQAAETGSTIASLREPSYRAALWAWGRAEARAQLLIEHLIRLGDLHSE
jgi:hypothetical protein